MCAEFLAQKENDCGQKKKGKAKRSKAKQASNKGGAKATAIKVN
jgi:hypothetical protein